ncbi:hypothetical protein [Bradyrhizobium liaoningense]|uniref:hypothetical protein n=1 Tax=Bradyrhizobium liaoningense TaxID=43992 RepID=UPI001BA89A35|nr:hypothetical protein [Bradyrhizobium liaoningense]MBR1169148.1 hypothetical protein [Bradyrhizobium liaoningense]
MPSESSAEKSKSVQDQRGAAYHEAGHAVVARALGLAVGSVEIAIDDDDAKGAAEIEKDSSLSLLDQVAICAAGLEAQKLFDAPTHRGAGWGDYGMMVKLLEGLEEDEQLKMMHQGHKRAFDLVSVHRAKVERLALALIEKKRLGANEVASLLAD